MPYIKEGEDETRPGNDPEQEIPWIRCSCSHLQRGLWGRPYTAIRGHQIKMLLDARIKLRKHDQDRQRDHPEAGNPD